MSDEIRGSCGPIERTAVDFGVFAEIAVQARTDGGLVSGVNVGSASSAHWVVAPELPDNVRDAVFNVAARFPIKFMEPGVVYKGLPVEVSAFVNKAEDELGRLKLRS